MPSSEEVKTVLEVVLSGETVSQLRIQPPCEDDAQWLVWLQSGEGSLVAGCGDTRTHALTDARLTLLSLIDDTFNLVAEPAKTKGPER